VELDPSLSLAWTNRAAALGVLGRYEEALASTRRAVELDPVDARAWQAQGKALEHLGRHEEAQSCYKRAGELDSDILKED